jgi:predicted AAA+ superfamily ATPase
LGKLLETFVIAELIKQRSWSESEYSLRHFRDWDGREVDIVIELADGRVIALEVKAALTVSRKDFSGLRYLSELLGERFICGIVLNTGSESQQYGDNIYSAPIGSLWL